MTAIPSNLERQSQQVLPWAALAPGVEVAFRRGKHWGVRFGTQLSFNLVRPPAAWLELVAAFGGGTAAAGAPRRTEPPGREQSFCVRAALIQGTRTRTLLVRCASESAARELALAELGDEWKILSVESGRS